MLSLDAALPRIVVLGVVVFGLAACTQSRLRLDPNFGSAIRQDAVAQIADPDAHYRGTPAPGSNGARVELAQKRYEEDKVTPPAASSGAAAGTASTSIAPSLGSNGQ